VYPNSITKRDGRNRTFNSSKILNGILSAMQDTESINEDLAQSMTNEIIEEAKLIPDIKAIDLYDLTVKKLIDNKMYDVVASYINFRNERDEIRDVESDLMKTISKITKETTRDNANIGNSPSSKMLQIGSAASKKHNLSKMPKHIAKAHASGAIHIHDLDYLEKTINCLQIDLGEVLKKGFDAGRGYIRPPKRIGSAAALAAIILQCNQNDMYGGQSFDQFDTYMAPHVPEGYASVARIKPPMYTMGNSMEVYEHRQARREEIRNEVYQAMEGFVYNLNSMHSRAGNQCPFSSINFGCDTTPEGRLVSEMLLKAFKAGLGRGEIPLFPNLIFRLKEGINMSPGDRNYDLFKLACEVAAKRMNPTFSFMDMTINKPYGIMPSYMGCRSRVQANVNGEAIAHTRGNIGFVTMNLPRLAIEAKGNWKKFYKLLDKLIALCEEQLLHRYEVTSKLRVKDLPFLMGQHLYMGSENLKDEDTIEEATKHGTLAIGYIGIAEVLQLLNGKHHGEDEQSHADALNLAEYIALKVKEMTQRHHLNFTTIATPAEGLSGRFISIDKEKYGDIPGVTDKGYYVNSYHIPPDYGISMFNKLKLEGPFHKFCDAGHISYVELESAPTHNPEAIMQLVLHAASCDMGYMGINFPIDHCGTCGYDDVIDERECPKCGSSDIKRIRRVTGYLSSVDKFGDGKTAELKARIIHN